VLELTERAGAVRRHPWEFVEEENEFLFPRAKGIDRHLEGTKSLMPTPRSSEGWRAAIERFGERLGENLQMLDERSTEAPDHLEPDHGRVLKEPTDEERLADATPAIECHELGFRRGH
jgi:hypothetical protein